MEYFNPRSYKRSDGGDEVRLQFANDFNPRSYKRSDPTRTPTANPHIISIHAPTRGATIEYHNKYMALKISIHAPTRGATLTDVFNEEKVMYFNPRSYKRSDRPSLLPFSLSRIFQSTLLQEERPAPCTRCYWHLRISIHAPTRGATGGDDVRLQFANDFNPRSYKRSDRRDYGK